MGLVCFLFLGGSVSPFVVLSKETHSFIIVLCTSVLNDAICANKISSGADNKRPLKEDRVTVNNNIYAL